MSEELVWGETFEIGIELRYGGSDIGDYGDVGW